MSRKPSRPFESFVYDAAGQLDQLSLLQSGYTDNGDGTVSSTGVLDRSAGGADYTYDLLGRSIGQIDYTVDQYGGSSTVYQRDSVFNARGQLDSEVVTQRQGFETLRSYVNNDYDTGTTDSYALGALVSSTNTTNKIAGGTESYYSSVSTSNSYNWFDGSAIAGTVLTTSTAGQAAATTSTYYGYDAGGTLISAQVNDGRRRTVSFTNDLNGLALRRDEADQNYDQFSGGDPHEVWYRFGGKQMGYVGNNGSFDEHYTDSLAQRGQAASTNAFEQGYATIEAEFGAPIARINSYTQGGAGGSYAVRRHAGEHRGAAVGRCEPVVQAGRGQWPWRRSEPAGRPAADDPGGGTAERLYGGDVRAV